MEDNNKKETTNDSEYTGPTHGPQGVDKAPGEETSQHDAEFTTETQKGKKVDADPSEEKDTPIEQPLEE